MLTIPPAQRRARLARRHRLAPGLRADDVATAAGDLVGLHATDLTSVYLAALARVTDDAATTIDDALYERRSVVRILGMRRTMFVVPRELAAVVLAACTRDHAARERRRLLKVLDGADLTDDPAAWVAAVEQRTLDALRARGEALSTELAEDVPELGEKILLGAQTRNPATLTIASRILLLLSGRGHIVRGRPRGSWKSGQYRYALTGSWLGVDLPELDPDDARETLARAWLARFGPATVDDLVWWTGWNKTQTRAALTRIAPVEVDLDGATGIVAPDDTAPVAPVAPWAALLPALDPTTMGWHHRTWYLGPHRAALFDRNGNAGPTIWWDGRVVGGWAQHPDGHIAMRLLEDVGADARAAVDTAAQRLHAWLGDRRFVPKFRTPLERELSS